jgi:hypothetical protein
LFEHDRQLYHALVMSFVTALATASSLAALRGTSVAHEVSAAVRIAAANI